MDLQEFWKNALGTIELEVSRPNFITWLKNSELVDKQEGTAIVALPNVFAKEWVQNKYYKTILASIRSLDETTKKVEFVVKNANRPLEVRKPKEEPGASDLNQTTLPGIKIDPETNLNPRYALSSFVVGKSNELAYAAAVAVMQDVGKKYNPLFLYGGVGVGKTHLVQAIGNEIKNLYQNKIKVRYVPSEKFINDVVWAVRNKRMETIKEKYRGVDVLIIDDIQFIGGKPTTEEEFFHTFNALYENNKQIIISSDRPPKFLQELSDRMRSRFEAGMIADIGIPDFELRLAVLKNKLEERKVNLSESVISYIAQKVQKNLRELEGALNRVLFIQQTKNTEITPEIVEQLIAESIQEPSKNINPQLILKTVADIFEVPASDLTGKSRKKEIAEPRQIIMYLLRDLLGMSFVSIGEKLGKRDHTTAIYAFEKITNDILKNPNLNQKIIMIKDVINQNQ